MPDRTIAAKSNGMIFNPFFILPEGMTPARMTYRLEFKAGEEMVAAEATVSPKMFTAKTALRLPMRGRILVDDGNDFYGHHRRLHFTHPFAKSIGFNSNFMRYAIDFVAVDEKGERHRGDGMKNEQWFGWGRDVVAPGSGVVAASYDQQIDNDIPGRENNFDERKVATDPMSLYGNYVVIDHGKGEFSLVGHVQKGSVRVRKGDRVKAGDVIAKTGSSGSSIYPHVHYELRTSATIAAEGLPPYFRDFRFRRGSRSLPVVSGLVNSGDFIESK